MIAFENSHGSLSNRHLDPKDVREGLIVNFSSYYSMVSSTKSKKDGDARFEEGLVCLSHTEYAAVMTLCTTSFPYMDSNDGGACSSVIKIGSRIVRLW